MSRVRPPVAAISAPGINRTSSLLLPLHALALFLLHVAFALSRLAHVVRSQITFFRQLNPIASIEEDRLLELDKRRARWNKTPKHFAVVFVPSNRAMPWSFRWGEVNELKKLADDLERLVVWCEKLGIACLSVYDEKGVLDRNAAAVMKTMSLHAPILAPTKAFAAGAVPGCSSFRLASPHISAVEDLETQEIDSGCSVSNDGRECPPPSTSSPTLVSPPPELENTAPSSLKINLLSRLAGRPYLARVARELATRAGVKSPLADGVLEEVLEGSVLSEPDLLLVLGGPYLRLRGFPPWQLRLTEMHHHSSPSWLPPPKLSYAIVREALDVYGGAEMRLGR